MTPEIQIILSRDSVCIGDDIYDHTKTITIAPLRSTTETIMCIAKDYLPHVAGNGHAWDCILNEITCAVINGNCKKVTCTADVTFLETNSLYFKYHSATY